MPLVLVLEPKAPHVRVAEIRAGSDAEERRLISLWRRVTPAIDTALKARCPTGAERVPAASSSGQRRPGLSEAPAP